jgi:hypothetical protein
MTVTETAEQIVDEVENCNRYGDDMHERDKLVAIEIVSKLLTIRDAKVREEEKAKSDAVWKYGVRKGREELQEKLRELLNVDKAEEEI